MREVVHGNGVAQAGFRIVFEHLKETMQFLVADFFELVGDAAELSRRPIFDIVNPGAMVAGVRHKGHSLGKGMGEQALQIARGIVERRIFRLAGRFRKIGDGFAADVLLRAAEKIFEGWRLSENDARQLRQWRGAGLGGIPRDVAFGRRGYKICDWDSGVLIEGAQPKLWVKEIHWMGTERADFGVCHGWKKFCVCWNEQTSRYDLAWQADWSGFGSAVRGDDEDAGGRGIFK